MNSIGMRRGSKCLLAVINGVQSLLCRGSHSFVQFIALKGVQWAFKLFTHIYIDRYTYRETDRVRERQNMTGRSKEQGHSQKVNSWHVTNRLNEEDKQSYQHMTHEAETNSYTNNQPTKRYILT